MISESLRTRPPPRMESLPTARLATDSVCWTLHGGLAASAVADAADDLLSLHALAKEARERAYAPYSLFRVGAAIRMDGKVFTGANVENASYGGTICAERSAIVAAVSAGCRRLELLAVSTGAEAGSPLGQRSPCGLCRQVVGEFAAETLLVLLDAGRDADGRLLADIVPFELLMPWRFRLDP